MNKNTGVYVWAGAGAAGGDAYKQPGERYLGIPVGATGIDQDGIAAGTVYYWSSTAWVSTGQIAASFYGAGNLYPIDSGPLYEDGTYQYGAEATVGTALTATEWLVWRRKLDDQRIEYASANYEFAYTDLATAQAAFV